DLNFHPVVDVEVIGKGTKKGFVKNLRKFLEGVEKELGVKPIIYTSYKFWNKHIKLKPEGHHLWVAEYGVDKPALPDGWKDWSLWQYKENKRLAGIEKDVDFSYFNCDHKGI